MMDDSGPTASILIFLFLLMIEMIFYGFDSALWEISKTDLDNNNSYNTKKTKRLLGFLEKPARFINTTQLVITLVHIIIGGYYFTLLKEKISLLFYLNKMTETIDGTAMLLYKLAALLITIALLLFILLTVGVLIPKRIARKNPEKVAYMLITPIYFITLFFYPITGFVMIISEAVLRIFGLQQAKDGSDVTEEEIISMVNEGHEQGILLASEAEMITNIFEYGEKEAQDIMTPRTNIVAIDDDMLLKDAIHFMLKENNSRYPVYEESIDYISGIINLKDALRIHATDETLNKPLKEMKGLIREAHFVPETRKIDSLFKSMQSMKIQMMIVVDEYGQTVGLVAMEDILEEIVGNILDEYDEDEEYIEDKGNDEYIIEGLTPLEELEEKLQIEFYEEEFDTLNGYLISKMEKIPEEGEEFEIIVDEYLFKVISVQNKMIQSVLVTKISDHDETNEQKEMAEA